MLSIAAGYSHSYMLPALHRKRKKVHGEEDNMKLRKSFKFPFVFWANRVSYYSNECRRL
jgi:hypothetical protein